MLDEFFRVFDSLFAGIVVLTIGLTLVRLDVDCFESLVDGVTLEELNVDC